MSYPGLCFFQKRDVRVSFPPFSWGTKFPLIGQTVNSENASEGDPAVTGRVMDFHETELFGTVCYLAHVGYTQFSH